MRGRRALALALGLMASAPAVAYGQAVTPRSFDVTYDWTDPSTGFFGWETFQVRPQAGSEPVRPEYYRVEQNPPAYGRGAVLRPGPATNDPSGAARPFPNNRPGEQSAGPQVLYGLSGPSNARARQLQVRDAGLVNQNEGQLGRIGTARRSSVTPPFAFPARLPFVESGAQRAELPNGSFGAAGTTPAAFSDAHTHALVDLRTICNQNDVDGACPSIVTSGTPPSHARVGTVVASFWDADRPTAVRARLPDPRRWFAPRGEVAVLASGRDATSGIAQLSAQDPGGNPLGAPALQPRDRRHTSRIAELPESVRDARFTFPAPATGAVRVRVTDDSGQSASASVRLRIDSRAPTLRLTPGTRAALRRPVSGRERVRIEFQIADAQAGPALAELLPSPAAAGTQPPGRATVCSDQDRCQRRQTRTVDVDPRNLPTGAHRFSVATTDLVGNRRPSAARFTLLVDRDGPNGIGTANAQARRAGRDVQAIWGPATDRPGGRGASGTERYIVTPVENSSFETVRRPVTVDGRRISIADAARRIRAIAVQGVDRLGNLGVVRLIPITSGRAPGAGSRGETIRPAPGSRPPMTYGISEPGLQNAATPSSPDPAQDDSGASTTIVRAPNGDSLRKLDQPSDETERAVRRSVRATLDELMDPARGFADATGPKPVQMIRLILPYDLWTSPKTEFDQFRVDVLLNEIAYRNATRPGPRVEPLITFMPTSFIDLDRPARGTEPAKAGACGQRAREIERSATKQTCSIPSVQAYSAYLRDWVENTKVKEGPNKGQPLVRYFGAWNEPDIGAFGLTRLASPTHTGTARRSNARLAGRRAAEYWIAARNTLRSACPTCEAVAGEFGTFSGDSSQAVVESYLDTLRVGRAYPRIWAIHNYRDLVPTVPPSGYEPFDPTGQSRDRGERLAALRGYTVLVDDWIRRFVPRNNPARSGYEYWITETGVLLQADNSNFRRSPDGTIIEDDKQSSVSGNATLQRTAGREFLRMRLVNRRITRALYYMLRAGGPTTAQAPNSPDFDSALSDNEGGRRGAFCGLRNRPIVECPGRTRPQNAFVPTPTPTPTP